MQIASDDGKTGMRTPGPQSDSVPFLDFELLATSALGGGSLTGYLLLGVLRLLHHFISRILCVRHVA